MSAVNIPKYALCAFLSFSVAVVAKAAPRPGKWKVAINREDGRQIVFNLRWNQENGKPAVAFLNGKEALRTTDVQYDGDTITVNMPVFESAFRFKAVTSDSLSGYWVRKLPTSEMRLPATAVFSSERFSAKAPATIDATGKYAIHFDNKNGREDPAIAAFEQVGSTVTGSILTPSGDYRYMEGSVSGDSLWLSTFDGVHALVVAGKINRKDATIAGALWSGAKTYETYSGKKEVNPTLPNTSAMYVKAGGSGHLDFRFKDLDGNMVYINDPRFKNKIVIIDLMGSWCPNCMDETAFLSGFYKKNKHRGVEVIGLAYEYSDDFARSRKSLDKFRKKFDVTYPMLITGVTVTDPQRTEKTLPQLTEIKMFPSTVILEKTGKVAFIDTGFQGPGTGVYYTQFVKEFNEKINQLLR